MPTKRLPEHILDAMVARGELIPAGAEHIRSQSWFTTLRPEDAVAKVFEYTADPTEEEVQKQAYYRPGIPPILTPGQRARNPLYRPDKSKTPLERIVELFPLKQGSAAKLAADWQFDVGYGGPADMARAIARRLEDRVNRVHLAEPPPLPVSEQTLIDIFSSDFYFEIPGSKREELAQRLAREPMYTNAAWAPREQVVQHLAISLTNAMVASSLGATQIAADDVRTRAVAEASRGVAADKAAAAQNRPLYNFNTF